MIATIIIIGLALAWLAYETDWLTTRLLVGVEVKRRQGKWQFLKYGDDALLLCQQCHLKYGGVCRPKDDRWFGWAIPAKTIQFYNSTLNFKEGCNYIRAKLLKDIVKAQKSKAPPTYKKVSGGYGYDYTDDAEIELLVDGKSITNINGSYKRGMIKTALKPYTTKARIGRKAFIMPVGEADRVAP